jgi:hypothetical protein
VPQTTANPDSVLPHALTLQPQMVDNPLGSTSQDVSVPETKNVSPTNVCNRLVSLTVPLN